ncbi:MAG: penicillin acylase family protein [Bacteroidota bacterium]
MRYFSALFFTILTIGACWFLDHARLSSVPLGFGRVLDPYNGFWQNMEGKTPDYPENIDLTGLKAPVQVHYGARGVPHIFAENTDDLYRAQGYITARDRLWQMEFQIYAASGRISELVFNPRAIELDRARRRHGMVKAAEDNLKVLEADPEMKAALDAYTAGVNAWIEQLSFAEYPLEYKLIDYAPEPWTNLKSVLLLKYMAWDLSGNSRDFENTNAFAAFGAKEYNRLFAHLTDSIRPIIPPDMTLDSASLTLAGDTSFIPDWLISQRKIAEPNPNNGSNNWVVAGSKTASGYPMLCNDPHLGLRLPAIWYEVQLTTPEHSVYGVSLPGSPMVIIGFNRDIAWGVTNSSRDVMDWYYIEYQDENKQAYRHDDQWLPVETRLETIHRRGQATFVDTVRYTLHGPVVYEAGYRDRDSAGPANVAMHWEGMQPDFSMRTFFALNRAKNYNDYRRALSHYGTPGQNFVFASREGDIAITQQGKFPAKWRNQGRFIMDGSRPDHLWQGYIPFAENPTAKNPERGYLFSANQAPVGPEYPYETSGRYDDTRSRRIDQRLAAMQDITPQDLQALQNDNFNQEAAEVLPGLLAKVDVARLSEAGKAAYDSLRAWNLQNEPALFGPAFYETWVDKVRWNTWKDEIGRVDKPSSMPDRYYTLHWLADTVELSYADDITTPATETSRDLLTVQLDSAAQALREFADAEAVPANWQNLNDVSITHLASLVPFSFRRVETGGNHGIVNANFNGHGPSWRMVVELGPEPVAYGVYPGGQSGNPGSPLYANMVAPWAEGEYFKLHFLSSATDREGVKFSQTINPEAP